MEDLPPPYELAAVGRVRLACKGRHEGPYERRLRDGHAHVRGHLERSELQQALPAVGGPGVEELVDADLRAVRVAGHVDEEVPQERVTEPAGGDLSGFGPELRSAISSS